MLEFSNVKVIEFYNYTDAKISLNPKTLQPVLPEDFKALSDSQNLESPMLYTFPTSIHSLKNYCQIDNFNSFPFISSHAEKFFPAYNYTSKIHHCFKKYDYRHVENLKIEDAINVYLKEYEEIMEEILGEYDGRRVKRFDSEKLLEDREYLGSMFEWLGFDEQPIFDSFEEYRKKR